MVNKTLLTEMKIDVDLGMLFSNLVMYFIILTTASVDRILKTAIRNFFSDNFFNNARPFYLAGVQILLLKLFK